MSNITDAQATATTNAAADKAAIGTGGSITGGSHTASAVTVVSGTAMQPDTKSDVYMYVNITTAAALKIEMGPTSAVATQISASQSSALGVITLRVPAGWYVKFTGTVADFAIVAVKA